MSTFHRELDDATAASIVRATQKDEYYLSSLSQQISDVYTAFASSRNPRTDPDAIKMWTKLLYFGVTTGIGAKSLGEQYVDLHYVNSGKRVRLWRRFLFVLMYATGPFIGSRITKWISKKLPEGSSLKKALDFITTNTLLDLQNLHLAIFYLKGRYYSISKRVLGLRYGIGYKLPPGSASSGTSEYEMLGGLMIIQLIIKYTGYVKSMIETKSANDSINSIEKFKHDLRSGEVDVIPKGLANLTFDENDTLIDLSDPNQLKYIPAGNRSCMLCLDPMKDPSCGPCGHIFCWSCILEWCNERSECPLCRSPLKDNQLIPLR